MDAELIALQGLAQVGFELQPFDGVSLHRTVEYFATSFSSMLCAIHSDLGIAENIFGIRTAGAAENNSDACGDHNLVIIQSERNSHALLNAFRHADGVAGVAQFCGEHNKFVAPKSRQCMVAHGALYVLVRSS